MLRPKILPQILAQANTNGVRSTVLLNKEGSLLASAGEDGKVVAAIFANIWSSFQELNTLDFILCECENGLVCLTPVTKNLYLCIFADSTAQLGMLKHKAELLKKYLEEPLKKLEGN